MDRRTHEEIRLYNYLYMFVSLHNHMPSRENLASVFGVDGSVISKRCHRLMELGYLRSITTPIRYVLAERDDAR